MCFDSDSYYTPILKTTTSQFQHRDPVPLPTHCKPGCDPSRVDNISTNSIGKFLMAGVLKMGFPVDIS